MNLYTHEREPVKLAPHPLGKGGSGEVFEVISPIRWRNRVAKVFYPRERSSERRIKLEYLIHYPPPQQNHLVLWPEALLFEKDSFAGCLLPRAESPYDLTYLSSLKLSNRLPAEWIHKYTRQEAHNLTHRAKICFHIASAICLLHQDRRYVHGDLKPDNFKVNLDQTVSLLDTDSVAVSENNIFVFGPDKVTQEFSPPEINHINPNYDTLDPSWDSFSLGIIFYKILLGLHPFSVKPSSTKNDLNSLEKKIQAGLFPFGSKADKIDLIPSPHQNFGALSPEVQELFIKTFDQGLFKPKLRPSALEWRTAFNNFNIQGQKYQNPLQVQKPSPKVHILSGKSPVMPTAGLLSNTKSQNTLFKATLAMTLLSALFLIGILNYKAVLPVEYPIMSHVEDKSKNSNYYQDIFNDNKGRRDYSFLPEGVIVLDKSQEGVSRLLDVKNNKMGYFLEDQEMVLIQPQYDEALPFHEGVARVKLGEKWGVINHMGSVSCDFMYDQILEFHSFKAPFRKKGKWGVLDIWGKEILPAIYDQVHPIDYDLIEVSLGGMNGYCNTKGFEIVPPGRYQEVGTFSDGRARVKLIDRYGFINPQGEILIPLKYKYASNFYHNRATVQEITPRGLISYEINQHGEKLGPIAKPYAAP